jgi:hypothetical protein
VSISPINCPDSGCYWAAHGIPDKYTEARAWHLAAHRAEEHGEPLTPEQIAYATKAGHVIPGSARTTAAAVAAQGALPVPVGNQPQPWNDDHAVQVLSQAGAMCGVCGDEPGDRKCPDCESCRRDYLECLYQEAGWGPTAAMRAEVQRLKAELERERENYKAYRIGTEGAKRMLADRVNAVTALCEEQAMAARMFELPEPEWIVAVREAVERGSAAPTTDRAEEAAS